MLWPSPGPARRPSPGPISSASIPGRPEILAVRCPIGRKEILLEAATDLYFDDDHYRGFPAILVRLDAIPEDELIALLKDAWRL
jgi:hypothetical protein